MPKLTTISRFLAPVALVALAACQSLPTGGDAAAPSTTPSSPAVESTERTEPVAQAPEAKMAEPLLVFLADVNPRSDWVEVDLDGSNTIYMEPEPFLTRNDLKSVEAGSSSEGDGLLALTLSEGAAARLSTITTNNPGKRLALVVDGTLLAIPGYSEPIDIGRLVFMVGSKENAITAAEIIAGDMATPMMD